MDYSLAKALMEDAKNDSAAANRGEIIVECRTGPSIDVPADKFYASRGTVTSNDLYVIEEAIGTNVTSGGLRM